MARLSVFNSPFLVGFDEIERTLDRVSKSAGDGYPPYNIERKVDEDGGERMLITLAVAGFGRKDLEVMVEENQLVIRGRRNENGEHSYLHQGIAARNFERQFQLAEHMRVVDAGLENGLLHVTLKREIPEAMKPRTIAIKAGRKTKVIENKKAA